MIRNICDRSLSAKKDCACMAIVTKTIAWQGGAEDAQRSDLGCTGCRWTEGVGGAFVHGQAPR